jgi:hypothetical protein
MHSLNCSRKGHPALSNKILTSRSGQVMDFVEALFALNSAFDRFADILRTFFVQLKQLPGDTAEFDKDDDEL